MLWACTQPVITAGQTRGKWLRHSKSIVWNHKPTFNQVTGSEWLALPKNCVLVPVCQKSLLLALNNAGWNNKTLFLNIAKCFACLIQVLEESADVSSDMERSLASHVAPLQLLCKCDHLCWVKKTKWVQQLTRTRRERGWFSWISWLFSVFVLCRQTPVCPGSLSTAVFDYSVQPTPQPTKKPCICWILGEKRNLIIFQVLFSFFWRCFWTAEREKFFPVLPEQCFEVQPFAKSLLTATQVLELTGITYCLGIFKSSLNSLPRLY